MVYADGSRQVLTEQRLSGDVRGVAFEGTEGGLLQFNEGAPGLAPEVTLHARNTRAYDGLPEHTHGGENPDVQAGDPRLVGTSERSIASESRRSETSVVFGDPRLAQGAPGQALAGQDGRRSNNASDPAIRAGDPRVRARPLPSAAQESEQLRRALVVPRPLPDRSGSARGSAPARPSLPWRWVRARRSGPV